MAVPDRSDSANQPTNAYPARVGSVGALAIDSAVLVEVAVTAEPPFESKLTVKLLASHLA